MINIHLHTEVFESIIGLSYIVYNPRNPTSYQTINRRIGTFFYKFQGANGHTSSKYVFAQQ